MKVVNTLQLETLTDGEVNPRSIMLSAFAEMQVVSAPTIYGGHKGWQAGVCEISRISQVDESSIVATSFYDKI